jgi:hypothetical protein
VCKNKRFKNNVDNLFLEIFFVKEIGPHLFIRKLARNLPKLFCQMNIREFWRKLEILVVSLSYLDRSVQAEETGVLIGRVDR